MYIENTTSQSVLLLNLYILICQMANAGDLYLLKSVVFVVLSVTVFFLDRCLFQLASLVGVIVGFVLGTFFTSVILISENFRSETVT